MQNEIQIKLNKLKWKKLCIFQTNKIMLTVPVVSTSVCSLSLFCICYGFLRRYVRRLNRHNAQQWHYTSCSPEKGIQLSTFPYLSYETDPNVSPYPCWETCKLVSGEAVAGGVGVREASDDRDESTSWTGATPRDDSISSKSLRLSPPTPPAARNCRYQTIIIYLSFR